MRQERIAQVEVFAALRNEGIADVQEVAAVVLETDGTFSVIRKNVDAEKVRALQNVSGYPPEPAS